MKTKCTLKKKSGLSLTALCLLTVAFSLISFTQSSAQGVGINQIGAVPDSSALLDLNSNSMGLLIPRMTSIEINNLVKPAHSLLVYQTDPTAGFYYNSGTMTTPVWTLLGGGGGGGASVTCTVPASNTHTIKLYDHWGDGWQGGTVDVYVNSSIVLSGLTLASGYGPATYTFPANTGDTISTIYTEGLYGYENYYLIYDAYMAQIGVDGNPLGYQYPVGIPKTAGVYGNSITTGNNTNYTLRGNGTDFECTNALQVSSTGKVSVNCVPNAGFNFKVNGNSGFGFNPNSSFTVSVDGNGHFSRYVGIGMNPDYHYDLRVKDNVGIGSYPSSSYKLSVDGNVHITDYAAINTYPSSSYKLRVNGNVGIGSSPSSSYTLSVDGTTDIETLNATDIVCDALGVGTSAPVSGIKSAGKIEITTGGLDVTGTTYLGTTYTGAFYVNSSSNFYVPTSITSTSSGVAAYIYSGRVYKYSSSKRYKDNIEDMVYSSSVKESVFKIKPKTFVDKSTGRKDFGLIAEEVEEVLPTLVIYEPVQLKDADGKPMVDKDNLPVVSKTEQTVEGVKYDRLSIYLLEIIKDHDKTINELKSLIESQQKEIDALKKR